MKTPLYALHKKWGAQLVDFHGWTLPILYQTITQEHEWVRRQAGLFDVSHMGRLFFKGPGTTAFLQKVMPIDVEKMEIGQARYTVLLNPRGEILDDLVLYKMDPSSFMIVCNASNRDKVHTWFQEHFEEVPKENEFANGESPSPRHGASSNQEGEGENRKSNVFGYHPPDVQLEDKTLSSALIAIQGPLAVSLLSPFLSETIASLGRFRLASCSWQDHPLWVSRTGYTGEDGFEVCMSAEHAEAFCEAFMDRNPSTLHPIGLGARDTLRLEAGLCLYGNEMDGKTTPLELGLEKFIDWSKKDFIGKSRLVELQKEVQPQEVQPHEVQLQEVQPQSDSRKRYNLKRLMGLTLSGKKSPRSHYRVFAQGREVGTITSGTHSPTLGHPIAMALLHASVAVPGKTVEVEIRSDLVPAQVVKLPFYQRKKTTPH